MFFDFSGVFNRIQPALLREKLEGAGVDQHLAAWTADFLTNRPVCETQGLSQIWYYASGRGVPQGMVLSPFLLPFTHRTLCITA